MNGVVVYQNVKNAHELERIPVAAPVTVGTPAEKMYTAVMLQRDPRTQRLYLHDAITEKELDIRGTEHLKTHRGSDTTNSELYTADILRNALNVKSEQHSAGRSIDELAGKCEAEAQQGCIERLVSVRDAIHRSGPERKKSHRPLHSLWRHASDPKRRRWQIVLVRSAGCAKKEGNQRTLLLRHRRKAFGGIRAKAFCEQYTHRRRKCQHQSCGGPQGGAAGHHREKQPV